MDNTKKTKTNNSNTTNSKPIMVLSIMVAICVIIIIILMCLLLKNPDNNMMNNASDTAQNVSSDYTEASEIIIGTPDDNRNSVEIDTKYCTLLYPKEWENNLRTEIVDKDEYKVEFYGTVEEKSEQHLFDVIFNGSSGYHVGTLTMDGVEGVQLNIEPYESDFDDTWTDEEKDIIYAMSEDVNYIIGMLENSGAFEIAE